VNPNALTPEDLVNLKREKQNLIHERTILKAKLARHASYNRHPTTDGRTESILSALEREVCELEQQNAGKRAEIARLLRSDESAVVSELREESKMLHLELLRIRRERQTIDAELKEVTRELDVACEKFSPTVYENQQKMIAKLEREVAEQRNKNAAAKETLVSIRQDRETRAEEAQRAQESLADLKAQIRWEHNQIAALNQEMERMRAEHREVMERLALQKQP
jgi:chromosome segregation ATPase